MFKPHIRTGSRLALAAAMLVAASPAGAHHSAAMFDREKTQTIAGTVKQLQWTSPHCWLQVLANSDAGPVEWSIEMGAPIELYRGGWRPGILKAGDKVTVVFNPTRDGSKGGLYVSAVGGDGQPIGKAH